MKIDEIEILTKVFADARQVLADRVRSLQEEIQTIKRRRLPGIKSAINTVIDKQAELKEAVGESAGLFVRPKTMIMNGIKVGYKKAKGKLSWADDDQVVRLIEKYLPDQAEILIKTTKEPIKKALEQLPAADLKKIGVTVNAGGDQVVIKSTDDEIDKLVDALLKEDDPEKAEEEA